MIYQIGFQRKLQLSEEGASKCTEAFFWKATFSRVLTRSANCLIGCTKERGGRNRENKTAGFYDMTKWEEYRRDNERYVCESCMFADPKYVDRYGSCF